MAAAHTSHSSKIQLILNVTSPDDDGNDDAVCLTDRLPITEHVAGAGHSRVWKSSSTRELAASEGAALRDGGGGACVCECQAVSLHSPSQSSASQSRAREQADQDQAGMLALAAHNGIMPVPIWNRITGHPACTNLGPHNWAPHWPITRADILSLSLAAFLFGA